MIFTKSYSMGNKYQVYQALNHFIYGVGIPSERMTDDTKELYISKWKRGVSYNDITYIRITTPYIT